MFCFVLTTTNFSASWPRQAVDIARRRGYTKEQCTELRDQFVAYNAGVDGVWPKVLQPGMVTATTKPDAFWRGLQRRVPELAALALVILAIVPHASSPECVFSALGWFQGGRRCNLSVGSVAQMTTIKMHLDALHKK